MARPQKTDINAFVTEMTGKLLELRHRADEPPYNFGAVREELETSIEELRTQNEELQRARLEAEAEHRRYRELFHGAPDPYFVTDRNALIIEGNRAAALALEVPTQFFAGRPLVGFVARQDCRKMRETVLRLTTKWSIEGVELRMRPRRGGPVFLASVSAVAVAGLNGKPAMVRWMMRDITKSTRVREAAVAATVLVDLLSKDTLAPDAVARARAHALSIAHILSPPPHDVTE
jgi:PAS domain S-box-containing protein